MSLSATSLWRISTPDLCWNERPSDFLLRFTYSPSQSLRLTEGERSVYSEKVGAFSRTLQTRTFFIFRIRWAPMSGIVSFCGMLDLYDFCADFRKHLGVVFGAQLLNRTPSLQVFVYNTATRSISMFFESATKEVLHPQELSSYPKPCIPSKAASCRSPQRPQTLSAGCSRTPTESHW